MHGVGETGKSASIQLTPFQPTPEFDSVMTPDISSNWSSIPGPRLLPTTKKKEMKKEEDPRSGTEIRVPSRSEICSMFGSGISEVTLLISEKESLNHGLYFNVSAFICRSRTKSCL